MPLALCFWVFLISLDFRMQTDFSWAHTSLSLLGLDMACLLAYNGFEAIEWNKTEPNLRGEWQSP